MSESVNKKIVGEAFTDSLICSRRLDMHEHVPNVVDYGPHLVLHFMRDFVRSLHRHFPIHLNMHVHVKLVAHFPDQTFLDPFDSRNGLANFANPLNQHSTRRPIH